MTIVVGGEALVDLVPHAAGELRAHAGGGPYNTARTLGRLEQDVHYLGCLSDDGFGARLRTQLVEDDVRLDTVVETPLPTTLALAELDASGAATYRFYTEGTSAPALEPEAALAALPERVDVLHVGTLGLVMEPTAAGAAGGRRGGQRPRAGGGRPELPPDVHPRSGHLPTQPGGDARPHARGQGLKRRPLLPRARGGPGRRGARAARGRPAGRARHARRRGRDDRDRRGHRNRARADGRRRRHDRRRRRVRRRLRRLLAHPRPRPRRRSPTRTPYERRRASRASSPPAPASAPGRRRRGCQSSTALTE